MVLLMRPTTLITSLALLTALAFPLAEARAQSCCGTPQVAYSPVAPAPVAVVQTQQRERSRLAKILDPFELFSRDRTTTTVNYAPTATGYTAGYTPYAVGYAPLPYTAAYAPAPQIAYRPTYPATYGAVAVPQTVSRPVVLSPVVSAAPACNACSVGCEPCNACGGVEQAYYGAPSTGCSSCNAGASFEQPMSGFGGTQIESRPRVTPGQVSPERAEKSLLNKPEVDDAFGDEFESDFDQADPVEGNPAAASDYWRAPPLYAPSNRVTQRSHPAPARTAVYRRPADVRQTAFRPAPTSRPKVNVLSEDGWGSAAN